MRSPVGLALCAVLLIPTCGMSPSDETADLCHDLDQLHGTIGFLAAPRLDVTVGLVRSAVDKLEPTFTRVAESETVPPVLGSRLLRAQEAYAAVLEPYSDDESIRLVTAAIASPARRLTDSVTAVESGIDCEGR
jgi:hypothetical protein